MNDSDAFGYYLSGLTDGEGCFLLAYPKQGNSKYPKCHFQISLRSDDYDILVKIKEYLNCGRIYTYEKKKANPISSFIVYTPEDLYHKVIPTFIKYPLRAKKKKDFEIWKQAVELCYIVKQTYHRDNEDGRFTSRWNSDKLFLFESLKNTLKSSREYKEVTYVTTNSV